MGLAQDLLKNTLGLKGIIFTIKVVGIVGVVVIAVFAFVAFIVVVYVMVSVDHIHLIFRFNK